MKSISDIVHAYIIRAFFLLVVVLTGVLIATVVITDRQSGYEKINPKICIKKTDVYEFDYLPQKSLIHSIPDDHCKEWTFQQLPFYKVMPDYAELPERTPLSQLWMNFKYKVPDDFEITDALALYGTRVVGGILAIYVNGELITDNEPDWFMQWNYPLYLDFPVYIVKPGQEIDIKIAIPFREVAGFSIGSFYIGSPKILKKWSSWRTFFSIHLPTTLSILFVILGFISLILSYSGIDSKNNKLFFVIASVYAISNSQYIYNIPDIRSIEYWFLSITDSSISWFFSVSSLYAFNYSKTNLKWVANIIFAWSIFITIITLPIWHWHVIGFLMQHYITMFLYMFLVTLLIYVSVKEKNITLGGITFCIVGYMAGGIYDLTHVSDQTHPDGFYVFTFATTPLMFFFLGRLLRNYITSHNQALAHNAILKIELEKQKIEIEEKSKEIEKQATMLAVTMAVKDERARLMRDIHDGVLPNVNLLSIGAREYPEEILGGFKEISAIIQAVVLSLQIESTSLNAVIASFRKKLESTLNASKVELVWEMDDLSSLDWVGPSESLQILFFLQESINNALKHSNCSQLVLGSRSRIEKEKSYMEIFVQDNGIGLKDTNFDHGHGQKNLAHRASKLGARLVRKSLSTGGVFLALLLPIKAPKP